jgi:hypothetical protein
VRRPTRAPAAETAAPPHREGRDPDRIADADAPESAELGDLAGGSGRLLVAPPGPCTESVRHRASAPSPKARSVAGAHRAVEQAGVGDAFAAGPRSILKTRPRSARLGIPDGLGQQLGDCSQQRRDTDARSLPSP